MSAFNGRDEYLDARRGVGKRALVKDGLLVGPRLIGETAASGWLEGIMVDRQPTTELRRWLLAPIAKPPAAARLRGRVICNCQNVAEADIVSAVAAGDDFAALQTRLRCGTTCGSCIPELRRLVSTRAAAA